MATIIGILAFLIFPFIAGATFCLPPEYQTQAALNQIEMALTRRMVETGDAPTDVDDFAELSGTYIEVSSDPEAVLTQLVMTGTDYWGNRLVIQSVPNQEGRFTLRSLGPDGLPGTNGDSDDLTITYAAETTRENSDRPTINSLDPTVPWKRP